MQLSTRSRYGARAVLDIALHAQDGPVTLGEIARRQDVSTKYLGHIVNPLIAAGILESIRGPRGGYVMGRAPEDTRLGDIIRTLDGSMAPARCVDRPGNCSRAPTCAMREVWTRIKDELEAAVDRITVADLMVRQRELEGSGAPKGKARRTR